MDAIGFQLFHTLKDDLCCINNLYHTYNVHNMVWCDSVMVKALDLQSANPGFDFHVTSLSLTTLGKLFTHVPLSSSSIIWYQPKGGNIGDTVQLGRYLTADLWL